MTESPLQTALPLTETTFFILLSLAPGKKHGYAIMKDVATLSDDRLHIGTGTLYGALSRLLEQGWVQRIEEAEAPESGRVRKDYVLTTTGRRVLSLETDRLRALVHVANLRLVEERA